MLFVEETHNEPRNSNFIKDVFATIKKYFEDNGKNTDNAYRSQIPSK